MISNCVLANKTLSGKCKDQESLPEKCKEGFAFFWKLKFSSIVMIIIDKFTKN